MPLVGRFGSLAGLGSLILPGGAMESIATVSVGSGGASSIEFTSIPGTYQHLQIRLTARTTRTASELDGMNIRFNSDSGGNYSQHWVQGNGAAAAAAGYASQTRGWLGYFGTNGGQIGCGVVDILDYASTSKNKTVRTVSGTDANGSGMVTIDSSAWFNTSAITSILIYPDYNPFAQHSTAALYGLRAP